MRPRSDHEFVCSQCASKFVAPYDDEEFERLAKKPDGAVSNICDGCWRRTLEEARGSSSL